MRPLFCVYSDLYILYIWFLWTKIIDKFHNIAQE